MSVNYREPQWLLPNEKNLQYPAAGATQGSGLTEDRHSLYSMDFDGSNDYISTSDIRLGDTYSISLWFNAASFPSTNPVLISQYTSGLAGRFFLGVRDDGGGRKITAFSAAHNYGSTVISTSTWYNVVLVNNNNTVTLYLNGAVDGNFTFSSAPPDTNILIGSLDTTPSNTWDGEIDEVAIFSRALSSDEITTLYNSGSPSNPMLLSGKPEAYYPLGEQARKPGTAEWRFPNEVLQGQAIDFDGIDDYIDIGNLQPSTTSLSISAWAYKPDTTNGSIIGNGPSIDYGIFVYSGTLQFGLNTGGVWTTTATTLPTNQWFHVLATWDGATMKLYVNGTLANSTSKTGTITDSINTTTIGKNSTLSGFEWNGKISNVALWGSDQSANIANIYNYGAPQTSYTVTPTAWYKLDKTSEYAGLNPNWHNALSFNGSNYIDVPTISLGTTQTLSWWINRDSSATQECPFGDTTSGLSDMLVYMNGLTLYYRVGSTSLAWTNALSTALTNQKWCNIILTRNGASAKLYLNGDFVSEQTLTGGDITAAVQVDRIGASSAGTPAFYINGKMSNVAIYDQVISAEDIKYLYNGGTPQTNISFEPTSWYKLDNLTTGIQDSGSASNNGTNSGATAVSSSVAVDQWNFDNAVQSQTPNWSSALKFDDTNDYIDCGNNSSLQISTDISISCWFRCTDQGILFSKGQYAGETGVAGYNYQISVRSPGYGLAWQWYTTSSEGASTGNRIYYLATTGKALTVIDGQWHNIVVTRSSSNSKLYVDGEYIASTGNTGTDLDYMVNSSQNVTIGDASNSPSDPFPGDISNIQIWNTQLTDADALSIYNSGQPSTTAFGSPVSWWKLDNTTTGIQDSIGSNNGTNNGATETQTNVWTPRLNGESDTLPSTALVSSDLQFNSAYSSFSLDFDGTNDYVDCTDSDTFTFGNGTTDTPFSLSGWVNADSMNKFKMIAKMDATDFEYQFGTNATGKLSFTLYSLNTSNRIQRSYNSTAVSGVWQHWVATYDGSASVSGLKIYINGVRVDDTTATVGSYTAMQNTTSTLKLATTTLSNYANGKMDELAVFNKELNQAEITSIYNNGYPKDITALAPISWWRLGEDAYFDGTDFTIPNKISGAPNGTSDNMAATALVAAAPGSYAAGLGSSLALDDRVGDAALSTANSVSFNMTPVNRVSYPAGYVPTQADNVYSMAFDGASDYIYTPSPSLGITNTWSVSAWVKTADKTADSGSYRGWFATGGWNTALDFKLSVRDNNGYASVWEGGVQRIVGTSDITDDNWYNVVLTKTASDLTLFVNGVQQATVSNSSTWAFNNIYIGAGGQSTGITTAGMWNGNIDELAVFDYALSARQIKQDIYEGTTSGKTADLNNISNLTAPVAWYRMGD